MLRIPVLKLAGMLVLAASPQLPVAVVEEVNGDAAGIQFMDYVEAGQVIKLGPQDSVILGYLKSCLRETITGGTVIVGAEKSDVQGGKIERAQVACDRNNKMESAGAAVDPAGGMIFRGPPQSGSWDSLSRPQFTIYGLSPIIEVRAGGTLVIDRIDKPSKTHEFILDSDRLVHGVFFDLAKAGVVLSAGGVYRAKAGGQELIFKVDVKASPGQTPIISRLLRLQPGV